MSNEPDSNDLFLYAVRLSQIAADQDILNRQTIADHRPDEDCALGVYDPSDVLYDEGKENEKD